jgi:hypothetical protein
LHVKVSGVQIITKDTIAVNMSFVVKNLSDIGAGMDLNFSL